MSLVTHIGTRVGSWPESYWMVDDDSLRWQEMRELLIKGREHEADYKNKMD